MWYNSTCSAGVAHPVERHLAKVEVASSSLVTRSIKKDHTKVWSFFMERGKERLEQSNATRMSVAREGWTERNHNFLRQQKKQTSLVTRSRKRKADAKASAFLFIRGSVEARKIKCNADVK